MKHRTFLYDGEAIPKLTEPEHAAFLRNLQKAMLLSLEEQKLLTALQREQCVMALETRNRSKQKEKRRA